MWCGVIPPFALSGVHAGIRFIVQAAKAALARKNTSGSGTVAAAAATATAAAPAAQ
jgi:hypothetical protein